VGRGAQTFRRTWLSLSEFNNGDGGSMFVLNICIQSEDWTTQQTIIPVNVSILFNTCHNFGLTSDRKHDIARGAGVFSEDLFSSGNCHQAQQQSSRHVGVLYFDHSLWLADCIIVSILSTADVRYCPHSSELQCTWHFVSVVSCYIPWLFGMHTVLQWGLPGETHPANALN
jgi:hypothetical protein